MLDGIGQRLRSLRDIEGVLGSFMIGSQGELLARDVTAACGSDVLRLVSNRMQQLCDAFVSAAVGGPFESTTLCFPQYKLQIRALGSAFLVAVMSAEVNLPALKMAMNLLGRQLLAELEHPFPPEQSTEMSRPSYATDPGRTSRPPPQSVYPVAERISSVPSPDAPAPPRSYRGRRVVS